MKKYFMFAAVVTAGMLASCSSESLTGSDPKIETPDQAELVPIEINVATPMAQTGFTRGTGTVGGIVNGGGTPVNNDGTTDGAPANVWAGQSVNVYMFNKGTLTVAQFEDANHVTRDIYNNATLITPNDNYTGIATYPGTGTEAGRNLVRYYPLTEQYDFWGYRIDDATVNSGPTVNEDKMQVNITVDGTQDVLGAKTTDPNLAGTGLTTADIYSAKAARANIQPTLEFKHLMTRLTFEAYPGSESAKTVYVYGISVRALKEYNPDNATETVYQTPTGTLDIAGTGGTFEQKINWATSAADAAPVQFDLMKRDPANPTNANLSLVPLYNNLNPDWTANGAISMNLTAIDGSVKAPIGESIIAPDAKAYELDIKLVQKAAKYTNSNTAVDDDWEEYQFNTVKTVVKLDGGTTRFLPGYTYDFIFKVYGLERIEVTTVLKPWVWGESQTVITE